MPTITIDGEQCEFTPGQTVLQVANARGISVPQYCYHDALSIVASCRICLAEVWAPDPRSGAPVPYMGGKLHPTCQTLAVDGMVVRTDSPKAVANQKAVMEYLLINHPLDCAVCDQAGECLLQDYSYEYGRGVSRFEEQKVKQPKKDLGPHVYLYADRCIMCSRCVRFTREVTGTGELLVQGRGDRSEIDVFPGRALDNELSANVVDLCPVGALLDKDFLFAQRVWFLRRTASIDGITASGDNIWIEHNEGRIHRIKPRFCADVNRWWITDEVRYGWKHVHSEDRLGQALHRRFGAPAPCDWIVALRDAAAGLRGALEAGGRTMLVVSPMLSCEDAFTLARTAREIDPQTALAIGPVPRLGEDRVYPPGASEGDPKAFVVRAEKAPNARGVRRVLEALSEPRHVAGWDLALDQIRSPHVSAIVLTGNYPSAWATDEVLDLIARRRRGEGGNRLFVVLIDTLRSPLADLADVVLPAATWAEKSGSFENARGLVQAFEQAIPVREGAKSEGQIALDLAGVARGEFLERPSGRTLVIVDDQPGMVPASVEDALPRSRLFNAAEVRREMARASESLSIFLSGVRFPEPEPMREPDMEVVEL
jgi:NADH-quinone oxidoreductase subunit G